MKEGKIENSTGSEKKTEKSEDIIPPQYKGLSSELVEEIWPDTVFVDPEKNKSEEIRKKEVVDEIKRREKLSSSQDDQKNTVQGLNDVEILEVRKLAHAKSKMGEPNLDLMIELLKLDWRIGERFDAHGIAKGSILDQFDQLINLLENGIDPDRPFYTAPLENDPENKKGAGAGIGTGGGASYKDGGFILLGEIDQEITKQGIKYVLVNDAFYDAVDKLSKAYPDIKFVRADEAVDFLENVAGNN